MHKRPPIFLVAGSQTSRLHPHVQGCGCKRKKKPFFFNPRAGLNVKVTQPPNCHKPHIKKGQAHNNRTDFCSNELDDDPAKQHAVLIHTG